jgi:N6-L-threonylcarbamoyladenine synthase
MAKILGIESSCDETAAAVVDSEKNILSNIIYSQIADHQKYGGVVPEIASREHIKKIESVIDEALNQANISLDEIDAIGVTAGPGLIGGVIVGLMTAKAICAVLDKPLISVNHLEGHALICRLTDHVEFPFLLLLVSGGHCQYILAESLGDYKILGQTIDDALGEAFDKTAKLLNLGYPGGPIVEKMALKGNQNRFDFPKPLISKNNCDFSFSGLKTAVLREVEKLSSQGDLVEQDIYDLCASFQKTTADIVINKTSRAIKEAKKICPELQNFVISGGVAANKYINSRLEEAVSADNLDYYKPPLKLCTDNAVMIGWAAMERFLTNKYESDLNIAPRARWSLEDLSYVSNKD